MSDTITSPTARITPEQFERLRAALLAAGKTWPWLAKQGEFREQAGLESVKQGHLEWCLRLLEKETNMNKPEDAKRIAELEAECARLRATVCQQPNVIQCARLWESSHQQKVLAHHGLADEFGGYGCDAIDWLAAAYLEVKAELDRLRQAQGGHS